MIRLLRRRVRPALAALLLGGVAGVLALVTYTVMTRRPTVLPAPTGTAQVGRMRLDWVDASRADPLAGAPGVPRRLPVWIWYPASVSPGSQPAPVLPADWRAAESRGQGILERAANLVLSPLVKPPPVRSHAYLGAQPAPAPRAFPVLVMQPGMGQAVPGYTVLAENLASHGYVVIGVNEPGSSDLVVYADGSVARATPRGSIADNAGPAEVARQMNALGPIWRADAVFVLDQLERLNRDPASPFAGRLDLARVGLFGHSFGGASALAVCQQDSRCRAGADLDGTPLDASLGHPLPRPFLFVTEGYKHGCAADTSCRPLWQGYQEASGPAVLVSIAGARHSNFQDVDLSFSGLGRFVLGRTGVVGTIEPARALAITNAELVTFFGQYLSGGGAPRPWPPFPEVDVFHKP